jgi:hypothetical protein
LKKIETYTSELLKLPKYQESSAKGDLKNVNKIALSQKEMPDCLFKCKVELNGKSVNYKSKVLPFIESIPTMFSWAPLQKNIMVKILYFLKILN